MARQPGWETGKDPSQAWNFCWLGDLFLPGVVEVSSDKGRDIDQHKPKGSDGQYLEDEGYSGGTVTIRLTMTTEVQWNAYQEILPQIDPEQVGGVKRPYAIRHPEPNSKGIHSVYVKSIKGEAPTSGGGKVEVLECVQYFPLVKNKKTDKKIKQKGKEATEEPVDFSRLHTVNTFT